MYGVFDIGGTKTRASVSDGNNVREPIIFNTEKDLQTQIHRMKGAIESFGNIKLSAVSVGVAGILNDDKSSLLRAPHIPEWENAPLKTRVQEAFNVETRLENDTALVGLGEANFGAGKGIDIVAYITVSTGVGGVRIIDGKIDRNIFGFEPGHQIIDIDGAVCSTCGQKGHLEAFISGSALEQRTGLPPKEVHDEALWDEHARLLGVGLNNIAVMWSPRSIILGGKMITGDPCIEMDKIQNYFNQTLQIFPNKPTILKASLGEAAGLYGGIAHLNSLS